jgi:hypothetical protein
MVPLKEAHAALDAGASFYLSESLEAERAPDFMVARMTHLSESPTPWCEFHQRHACPHHGTTVVEEMKPDPHYCKLHKHSGCICERGEDPTNPKDRIGVTKVPMLSVVPAASLIHEALAMRNGAKKYGAYNWRSKEVRASVYADAMMRHLMDYWDGDNTDAESGCHPLAHAKACAGIILDALETGNLVDDRPPRGAAAALLEKWRQKR